MTLTFSPSRLPSWESAFEKFPIAALTDAPTEKSAPGERAAPLTTLGRLEHWPKQKTHTHTAEKLQRITIYPSLIRQFGEVARSRVAPAEQTNMSQRLNLSFTLSNTC